MSDRLPKIEGDLAAAMIRLKGCADIHRAVSASVHYYGKDKDQHAADIEMVLQVITDTKTLAQAYLDGKPARDQLKTVTEQRDKLLDEVVANRASLANVTRERDDLQRVVDVMNRENAQLRAKVTIPAIAALLAPVVADDEWEYATTKGPRKAWDSENEPPAGEGWIRDIEKGRQGWERFDFHEEAYWKRRKPKTVNLSCAECIQRNESCGLGDVETCPLRRQVPAKESP